MTGIMIKKCSEQQKKKGKRQEGNDIARPFNNLGTIKRKVWVVLWTTKLCISVNFLPFKRWKKKKKYTNLGPDFWNLRQHRRAHFVELDLLTIAKRDKTGTGEDSRFGDIYWACSRSVYRWTLLNNARRWHKCGWFNNCVSERIRRGHTIQQVV